MFGWVRKIFSKKTLPYDPNQRIGFNIRGRVAGVHVDEDTALQLAAVFRAVSYISQTLAWMPWHLFADMGGGKKKLIRGTPTADLLQRSANPEIAAYTFRETLLAWALLWGNGYAEIERDMAGRPIALWPISPDRVTPRRAEDTRLFYEIQNGVNPPTYLFPDEIFHLHGLGFDGLTGYSVVSLAANSIGAGLATEQFTASFFGNGTIVAGVLETSGKLTKEAREALREEWAELYGGPKNAGKPAILQQGLKWNSITMPLKDVELLGNRKYTVTEIARWFGITPHKLMDLEKATYSNIEHQSIEVINDGLMPWVVRLESEANRKLLLSRAMYTKLNLLALLRGDSKARAEFYKIMREIGVFSTNIILALEEMDPVGPAGDKLIVPLNFTTLDKIGEDQAANNEPPPEPDPEQAKIRAVRNVKVVFNDACGRMVRRESARFKDASKRYAVNRDGFIEWLNGFLPQHLEQTMEVIKPAVTAFLNILGNDTLMVDPVTITQSWATEYGPRLRQRMLLAFDECHDDLEHQGGVDHANELIEMTATAWAVKDGLSYEKRDV